MVLNLIEVSFLVTAPVLAPPRREPPLPAHPRVSWKGGMTHVPGTQAAVIRMRVLHVLDILETAGEVLGKQIFFMSRADLLGTATRRRQFWRSMPHTARKH